MTQARWTTDEAGTTLTLSVEDTGCGTNHVFVVPSGEAFPFGGAGLTLKPQEDGEWSAHWPTTRCGPPGPISLDYVEVRDRGGNQREYRKVLGEALLRATDGNEEIPLTTATLAGQLPQRVQTVEWIDPGRRLRIAADPRPCAFTAEGTATGPQKQRVVFSDMTWTEQGVVLELPDDSCLEQGTWRISSLYVSDAYGVVHYLDENDGQYVGVDTPVEALSFVVEEEPTGPQTALIDLAIDPTSAPAGWDQPFTVSTRFTGCPVRRIGGRLRWMDEGLNADRRYLDFDETGRGEIPACAKPGTWWIYELFGWDTSGAFSRWRLPYDNPSAGFSEAPTVPAARVELYGEAP